MVDSVTTSFWRAIASGDIEQAVFILGQATTSSLTISTRAGTGAVSGLLKLIFDKFPATAQQCDTAAQNVSKVFQAVGKNPQIYRFRDHYNAQFFFLDPNNNRQAIFSSRGYHVIVELEGKVFDALTGPEGMLWKDYIKKLNSLEIYPVFK